ncbi:MAG: peptide chain release factor [Crocinitomicaceae bacterium]|jgi:peptide chain release factor
MEQKIIQITSGRGPEECDWVVTQLTRHFLKEVMRKDMQCTLIKEMRGAKKGTLSSANYLLRGIDLENFLMRWNGSILWIGESPFRKNHKRKNWFVGFQSFDLNEEVEFDMRSVKIDVYRSSGPGGQHANKVESAVRATHLPSGISAEASVARSQHVNRQVALQDLKRKLEESKQQQREEHASIRWKGHNRLERGSPIRTYKGTSFKLHKLN